LQAIGHVFICTKYCAIVWSMSFFFQLSPFRGALERRKQMLAIEPLQQRLLPVKEWARVMGISVWTARQWAYSGKIASHKLGAKLVIPAGELDRVCAATARPALAAAE
jgi:excisionase family DNA binding protein